MFRNEEKTIGGEKSNEISLSSRKLDLFFALCTKQPSLLVFGMQMYSTASRDVKDLLIGKAMFFHYARNGLTIILSDTLCCCKYRHGAAIGRTE